MKKRLKVFVVLIGVMVLSFFLPYVGVGRAFAGLCNGDGCEGLNPFTMQCSSYISSLDITAESGRIETKSSTDCNSKWARLTNNSGANRFLAASIRYGGSNYDLSQSVSTPGKVGAGAVVYTPMTAPRIKPARGCGRVSNYGPISTPVDNIDQYCNGVSQY